VPPVGARRPTETFRRDCLEVEPWKGRGLRKRAGSGLRFLGWPPRQYANPRSGSGWFRGHTIEGTAVYTPYRRSEVSGWAFAMGIPASTVDGVVSRGFAFLGFGLAGAIAVAIALAYLVSRRIAAPIRSLASAAQAMGRGAAVAAPPDLAIGEVKTLALALAESARAIGERQELIEREKRALQAADRAKDEFLAMLSHELRNPLAALTAAAHVLKVSEPAGEASAKAK